LAVGLEGKMLQGAVKWFHSDKGYGFIAGQQVWFEITEEGYRAPRFRPVRARELKPEIIEEPEKPTSEEEEALGVAIVDGRLRLIAIQPDGAVKFLDPHQGYHHLLYIASLEAHGWKSLIEELEELINSPKVKEGQIQSFFERNPEFLVGDTYETAMPHIVLQRSGEGPLIPDFALKPSNANALCDLLELKLPTAKLLTGRNNRRKLSSALLEACAQLREYRDYFEYDRNRRDVEEAYGLRFFRPRMFVVIGKRSEYLASDLRKAESDVPNLSITTYDDLVERAKSRMRRHERKSW
jgi:Domain of unknown function (DUF4263)